MKAPLLKHMPDTSILMWHEWVRCWTWLTFVCSVACYQLSDSCLKVQQSSTGTEAFKPQQSVLVLLCIKALPVYLIIHIFVDILKVFSQCILERTLPSDVAELIWWRAEITFINSSPALRALCLVVEWCVKARLIKGTSSTDQLGIGQRDRGDLCQEGACPEAFWSSSTLKPQRADVSVSLSPSPLLNYTSEANHILFGSGLITSAQSRRRSLSVGANSSVRSPWLQPSPWGNTEDMHTRL